MFLKRVIKIKSEALFVFLSLTAMGMGMRMQGVIFMRPLKSRKAVRLSLKIMISCVNQQENLRSRMMNPRTRHRPLCRTVTRTQRALLIEKLLILMMHAFQWSQAMEKRQLNQPHQMPSWSRWLACPQRCQGQTSIPP